MALADHRVYADGLVGQINRGMAWVYRQYDRDWSLRNIKGQGQVSGLCGRPLQARLCVAAVSWSITPIGFFLHRTRSTTTRCLIALVRKDRCQVRIERAEPLEN